METKGHVLSNPAEKTTGRVNRSFSTFDKSLSHRLYHTPKFGYYTPTFVMDGVPTDEISLNSSDRVDSLSLNAPFKDNIRMTKSSFMVPKMAILPFNWEQIYTLPSAGDDVPDDANTVIKDFGFTSFKEWIGLFRLCSQNRPENSDDVPSFYTAFLRMLVIGEYLFSFGSLLNYMGYSNASRFRYVWYKTGQSYSYDWLFDQVVSDMFARVAFFRVVVPDGSASRYYVIRGLGELPNSGDGVTFSFDVSRACPFRTLFDIFRDNPTAYVSNVVGIDQNSSSELFEAVGDVFADYFPSVPAVPVVPQSGDVVSSPFYYRMPLGQTLSSSDFTDMLSTNFNYDKLVAYQIICAHYMTNSNLDFVYSADLYRQYWSSLLASIIGSGSFSNFYFLWNSVRKPYDWLSGRVVSYILFNRLTSWSLLSGQSGNFPTLSAWSLLFGFRRSLRYGDYFTGSRPTPLAPTSMTGIPVSGGMVDVIDVTRSIQFQRLRNASMRWRNKVEEYVSGLFGKRPAPDYHNPFILGSEESYIFGDSVQNTGSEQAISSQSRTSNLSNTGGRFTYTFHNDDAHPCIYMQLISFDVRRAYVSAIHRSFFVANRFDMFNPAFQYIGDQPVYQNELGYNLTEPSLSGAFGYKTRDAEYKESYDRAIGGFYENLPGWSFTDKTSYGINFGATGGSSPQAVINDDFIRSWPSELDEFFLSLSGYSLGSCFHFVFITDNNVVAKRPMSIDPQILA